MPWGWCFDGVWFYISYPWGPIYPIAIYQKNPFFLMLPILLFFIFMCSYKHLSGLHADYNRKAFLCDVEAACIATELLLFDVIWRKCATHDKKIGCLPFLYIANNFCPSNEAIRIIPTWGEAFLLRWLITPS